MKKISLHVVNSFSIGSTGGNPAGVVPGADKLTREQKQSVARQAGLSETAFVSNSDIADFKLEFFTPNKQIPHCGHATVATFWHLKSVGLINGDVSSKETIDGTRKIFFKGNEPYMEQPAATFTSVMDPWPVHKSLGAETGLIKIDSVVVGSSGNAFVLVRLNELSDLSRVIPDFDLITRISTQYNAIGYYVYAVSAGKSIIQTRMFAPLYGIHEESATGMAAGPLSCLLYRELKQNIFSINQGKYMANPSESKLNVVISATGDIIHNVQVGGSAYIGQTSEITI